jgi:23S rRNA (pseudouridine1915-N3)-methyltransferase
MKVNIISIGAFKNKDNYGELFEDYRKRVRWNISLLELKNSQLSNIEGRKMEEHKELLKRLTVGNKLIVLDERGEIITTTHFSNIFNEFTEVAGGIDFVIGGSDGLLQELREKADFILSFGKMVFPHLMVRVMLMEQLYRVYTIKNNHPYHK